MTDLRTAPDDQPMDEPYQGRSRLARNSALVVGAVLVLFVALLATRKDPGAPPNPLVGQRVPRLVGTDMNGRRVDLDKHLAEGKFVVVNFLAEWCIPCRQEHPDLKKFSEDFEDEAVVIGVVFNDEPEDIRRLFDKLGGDWPVIIDSETRPVLDFSVTGVPESFVVAPNGRVVAHAQGVTYDWLSSVLRVASGGADAGDLTERTTSDKPQSEPPTSLEDGSHQATTTTVGAPS